MFENCNIFSTQKCAFQQHLSAKSREHDKTNTTVRPLYHYKF